MIADQVSTNSSSALLSCHAGIKTLCSVDGTIDSPLGFPTCRCLVSLRVRGSSDQYLQHRGEGAVRVARIRHGGDALNASFRLVSLRDRGPEPADGLSCDELLRRLTTAELPVQLRAALEAVSHPGHRLMVDSQVRCQGIDRGVRQYLPAAKATCFQLTGSRFPHQLCTL